MFWREAAFGNFGQEGFVADFKEARRLGPVPMNAVKNLSNGNSLGLLGGPAGDFSEAHRGVRYAR